MPLTGYWKLLVVGSLLGFLAYFSTSCKPLDEEVNANPGSALGFSDDTVYFDTLYAISPSLRSITKRLKVYNPNSEAVNIQSISLSSNTVFSIVVNGLSGPQNNLVLRGNDSMYVLVTVKVNPNNSDNPFVIADSLIFRTEGINNRQKVVLQAYGQDAHFYRDSTIKSSITWDDTIKPYILIGNFVVDEGATLTIKEGVKVCLLPNSFFIVVGKLDAQGSYEHRITFGGYRREKEYENQSGQWGQILFYEGSTGNKINYAIIKNGFRGIQTNIPDDNNPAGLQLSNTLIKNFSGQGILAFNSNITAYNNVIIDCAQNLVACLEGGTYNFYFNTFTYSGLVGYSGRGQGTVFADNYDTSGGFLQKTLKLDLQNNLFLGTNVEEFAWDFRNGTPSAFLFNNNLIKSKTKDYANNNELTSTNAHFKKPLQYDFRLDSASVAVQGGVKLNKPGLDLNFDIRKQRRKIDKVPDSLSRGAYQYLPKNL